VVSSSRRAPISSPRLHSWPSSWTSILRRFRCQKERPSQACHAGHGGKGPPGTWVGASSAHST
jgi:hypothetical protein